MISLLIQFQYRLTTIPCFFFLTIVIHFRFVVVVILFALPTNKATG